ncbi:PaaI family thioesterase [Bacillus dakarensis]|uniref:PaaI family thioesterase n=1 Tax=Robertmurraya dakarensis TaxID=1926278 RepID=UPI000981CE7C|nr:PaaI family thioesterase [Bacillus dakarensis]
MKENMTNDYLQALRDDFESSPFWKHMGISFYRLEPGDVVIQIPVIRELMNTRNVLHGGAITTILDAIMGVTICSAKEVLIATASLTTQFLAPVTDGTLYASANIINPGQRIQHVEAKVLNENGNTIAKAVGTFAIIKDLSKEES